MSISEKTASITEILTAAGRIILGKETQLKLALACLLARGHLLIEDLPGKAIVALQLARLLGLEFSRIQFSATCCLPTSSASRFRYRERSDFRFLPGRCSRRCCWPTRSTGQPPRRKAPCSKRWRKVRSAVTAKRTRYPNPSLSSPRKTLRARSAPSIAGIATRPFSHAPRTRLSDRQAERSLLESGGRREQLPDLAACFSPEQLAPLQKQAAAVRVSRHYLTTCRA